MKLRTLLAVITATYAVTLYATTSTAGNADLITVGDGKKEKCTRSQLMDTKHQQLMMYYYHQRMIEAHREAGIDPYGDQPTLHGAVSNQNSEEAPVIRF